LKDLSSDTAPHRARSKAPRDSRQNPRKELVREELITKAAELFNVHGFAQTSMNDIASAVGLRRSAVYHYFGSKEEILSALMEQEAFGPTYMLQAIAALPDLSATERLRRAVIDGIVHRLTGGARFIALTRLEPEIPQEFQSLYNQSKRQILDFYSRFISEGIETGEFRKLDVNVAAFAVIGMANWTSRWYSPSGSMSPQQIAEIIADFAIRGLSNDNGRPTHEVRLRIARLREEIELLERLST
jgi:AcrR family transcriptional regulator